MANVKCDDSRNILDYIHYEIKDEIILKIKFTKVLACMLAIKMLLNPLIINAVSDAELNENWSVGIKATANGTVSATITITMGSYFSQPIVITSFSWTNGSLPTGTMSNYSATFTVTKNATYTVTAKDSSGHTKTASVVVSNIGAADITKPTIGTPSVILNSAKTAATVTVNISDSGSGVAIRK